MDPVENVMKKCTLCVDRIYSETLPEEDRDSRLRAHLPCGRAAFRRFQRSRQSDVSKLVAERGGIDLMPEHGHPPGQQVPAATTQDTPASRHRRRQSPQIPEG
jgi:Fe-S-cluster-containing dehydrogenase component